MKNWIVLLMALLMLGGCAWFDSSLDDAKKYGAEAADIALKNAEWGACYMPTVGSLRRRYSGKPDTMAGWQLYCHEVWTVNGEAPIDVESAVID